MRFNLLAISLGIVLAFPTTIAAQSLGSLSSVAPFSVSVNPQYPTPGSQAKLSFSSATIDLANATLTVSVAGKETYKGSVKPVSVTIGNTGSVVSVKVTISSGGVPYSQTLFIQPQDVVLVIEPISSAPPFYLGIPLIPLGGSVRIVAMAHMKDAAGKNIDPATLSYTWTVDATRVANASGIGKTAIVVASPMLYRSRSVSVAVTSQSGSLVGGSSFSFTSQEPSVRIYENDSLLGIRFEHALPKHYVVSGTEATLYAAPFSVPMTGGAPILQWFLNGTLAQTGNSITLRPSGKGQGNASLSFVASSNSSAKATANLSLSFGEDESVFNALGL